MKSLRTVVAVLPLLLFTALTICHSSPLDQLPSLFSSPTLKQLHPLNSYRILSGDGARVHGFDHLHSDHHSRFHTANVHTVSDFLPTTVNGHNQPWPSEIRVQFSAMDMDFDITASLMVDLYHPYAKMEIRDLDDKVSEYYTHTLRSYIARDEGSSTWATFTLHDDGRFQGVVFREGEMYQVDPVEVHQQEMSAQTFQSLKRHATKGITVFKHSDLQNMEKNHICGAVENAETQRVSSLLSGNATNTHLHSLSSNSARRLLAVNTWTNCYPGDNVGHRVSIGFGVDAGYYAVWGSQSGVATAIAAILAASNLVYLQQLNIYLTLTDTVVYTATGGSTPAWNRIAASTGAKCTTTIDTDLNDFTAWRYASPQLGKNSLWHLMTNCYPPAGTVGLAWIGTLCNAKYSCGVSSHNRVTWLTVAHEIGHNFNAQHTFQNGQGATGGIMDYGDGRLPPGSGDFQFNTQYSKTEMCQQLTRSSSMSASPYCIGAYTAVCGNNIVEPGETCDDKSGCCDLTTCQLKSGSQCSGESDCCTGCKYKPSTSTCKSGQGYCKNGVCTDSLCTGYTGLSFCGYVTNNPCRQKCLQGSTCSDGYSSPNLNLADDTVCSLAPYSVCKSGRCTATSSSGGGSTPAPTVTYSWVSTAWSSCDCSGTQTRANSCKGSDGTTSSDLTKCGLSSQPTTTQSCTPPTVGCVTYAWDNVAWGACSVDCGSGTQTRTNICRSSTGSQVTTDLCTGTKPITSQTCNTQACPASWTYGDWTACSVSCGTGTSTRSATCYVTQNGVKYQATTDKCASVSKDVVSRQCNTTPCPTYSISYGVWGACSVQCGGGTSTRVATCSASDGSAPDTTYNKCAGQTRVTSQTCNTAPCATYSWRQDAWSECSKACGIGASTAPAYCISSATNQPVLENFCTTQKPATTKTCNTVACPSYSWAVSRWGTCSAACGGGVTYRSVACVNVATYVVVADSLCSTQGVKPDRSATCNNQACTTYAYAAGDWTSCTATCGRGIQVRSVKCVRTGSTLGVDWTYCGTQAAPISAQYCNTQACKVKINGVSVIWVQSEWSDCSKSCGGGGVRTRSTSCINNSTQEALSADECGYDLQPSTVGSCGNFTCPTFWWTGEFSQCDASCGAGTQTRAVECRLADDPFGAAVADDQCSGQKPSTTGPCNVHACPTWDPNPWGDCSAACGDGTRTRTLECISFEGLIVDHQLCDNQPLPATSEVCNVMPCPHWHRGEWGDCSRPCGGGYQTRELVCRMPHDSIWMGAKAKDENLCPAAGSGGDSGDGAGSPDAAGGGKPAFRRACNTETCPPYYWLIGDRTECSQKCGGGVQTAPVNCMRSADNSVVSDNLCVDERPIAKWNCNTAPCPNYEWFAVTAWSDCSSYCGEGTTTREVRCRDTNPNEYVGIPYELVDDDKCEGQVKPATTSKCSNPVTVCQGDSPTQINGKCDLTAGQCTCRAGFGGQNCTVAPAIRNVQTNAHTFADGVPRDERLEISWDTMGSIDFVSILLVKDSPSWPFGQYIAQDVVNTNHYVWTVGERLKDLESGDGYHILIWFSNSVVDQSDKFTIADACQYTSCGQHGTCVDGACVCLAGYSGVNCGQGPCERAECSSIHSTCDNAAYVNAHAKESTAGILTSSLFGICNCTDGWKGSQCKTRPGCLDKCKNGGDYVNAIIKIADAGVTPKPDSADECGVCACKNRWTGSTCETCPLVCENGGKPDADCTQCVCPAKSGWFGSRCECNYYLLTVRLTMKNGIDWLNDPLALARFQRTIATDVAIAAGDAARTAVEVSVESVEADKTSTAKNVVIVVFRLSLPCIATSQYGSAVTTVEDNSLLGSINSHISNENWSGMRVRQRRYLDALHAFMANMEQTVTPVHSVAEGVNTQSHARFFTEDAELAQHKHNFAVQGIRTRGENININTLPVNTDSVSLLQVYTIVAQMFSNTDSPLYHGVVTSYLDKSFILQVSDPTGKDKPQAPADPVDPYVVAANEGDGGSGGDELNGSGSDKQLSGGAIAGIVIGVSAAILLMIGACLYFVFRRPVEDKTTSSQTASVRSSREASEVELRGRGGSSSQSYEPITANNPLTPFPEQSPGPEPNTPGYSAIPSTPGPQPLAKPFQSPTVSTIR